MEKRILKVPEWKGQIVFDYETVYFCLVIAFLLAGVILCFMGYKYMRTLCVAVLGCAAGVIGIRVGERLTQNQVLKMCLFVVSVYVSVAMIHVVSEALISAFRRLAVWEKLLKKQYIAAACLGAGVVAVTTYECVYRSPAIAAVLFVLLAVAGVLHGKKKSANRRIFYTYDDLCARKPVCGKEEIDA